jgi:hypothetical protein
MISVCDRCCEGNIYYKCFVGRKCISEAVGATQQGCGEVVEDVEFGKF